MAANCLAQTLMVAFDLRSSSFSPMQAITLRPLLRANATFFPTSLVVEEFRHLIREEREMTPVSPAKALTLISKKEKSRQGSLS